MNVFFDTEEAHAYARENLRLRLVTRVRVPKALRLRKLDHQTRASLTHLVNSLKKIFCSLVSLKNNKVAMGKGYVADFSKSCGSLQM